MLLEQREQQKNNKKRSTKTEILWVFVHHQLFSVDFGVFWTVIFPYNV